MVVVLPLLLLLAAVGVYVRRQSSSPDGYKYTIPGSDICYVEDASEALAIEEVVSMPDSIFQRVESSTPNFGFSRSSYWLRFTVHGQSTGGAPQFLEVRNPLLNNVELYERRGVEIIRRYITGDVHPFNSRPVDHPNFILPLNIPINESREYYLKVNTGGEQFLVPLTIWDKAGLDGRDHSDLIFKGGYFGILVFVLLFNLFIFLVVKERSSLFYMHYNLNLLLLQLSLSGLAFQHLWPMSPYLANVANPIFASLGVFALLKFSQQFLSLREYFPKINTVFSYIGYAVVLNAILAVFWTPRIFHCTVLAINGIAFLLNLAIFPLGYAVWKKGFQPARFFLIGFAVLILTVFAFIANNVGWMHQEFFAIYGLQIGSALEVVLLSFAIVHRFKDFKQKSMATLRAMNQLEREQNTVLERKVEERTFQLQEQTKRVANQNEEIISSIRYARRIQSSLLPSDEEVTQALKNGFVLYKPKDIVSGDFYWVHRFWKDGEEWTLFAVADCTGHGVPGALMSVMGQNFLKESVRECDSVEPSIVLNKLDEKVRMALSKQSDYSHASDGMDIAVGMIGRASFRLQFAGANNGLAVMRGKELMILDGDRRSIGMASSHTFELHHFQLEPNDHIYAWTDGLRDQFGGVKGKKLKTSGVFQWIENVVKEDVSVQALRLEQLFYEWKGEFEQVDDVCLLGIRV